MLGETLKKIDERLVFLQKNPGVHPSIHMEVMEVLALLEEIDRLNKLNEDLKDLTIGLERLLEIEKGEEVMIPIEEVRFLLEEEDEE